MKELLVQVAQNIWGQNSAKANLYIQANIPTATPTVTLANWLTDDIQTLQASRVFVLLLDHVYESDRAFLTQLEDRFLNRLSIQPSVLLIMAGRGQPYAWRLPELRLHVRYHHLDRFQEKHTKEQIEKQRPKAISRTTEIYKASRGYPLATFYLADYPTVAAGLQDALNGLLVGIEPKERSWLEALCILRAFDEERIPLMLSTYLNDPSIQSWSYKQTRATRDRLLQTQMARWSEKAGGWVMDQAVRPLLEQYLQQTQPDMWHRLHCRAYQFYLTWIQDYPLETIRWQEEADYHAIQLRDAGYDPEECP